MRTETYHAFMLDHATGSLAPALRLAGDLHQRMNDNGRMEADIWDCVGGILLDKGEVADGPDEWRAVPRACLQVRATPQDVDAGSVLATDLDGLRWRRGLAGVDYARAGVSDGQYMRLSPGRKTPEHGHSALEATVVLQGSLVVGGEQYVRGDLVIGAPGERHQPAAGACDVCICYVGREPRPFWRLS
ncbi:MAG: hypothetical protein AAF253_02265 [Pseudomonadota bacterium]